MCCGEVTTPHITLSSWQQYCRGNLVEWGISIAVCGEFPVRVLLCFAQGDAALWLQQCTATFCWFCHLGHLVFLRGFPRGAFVGYYYFLLEFLAQLALICFWFFTFFVFLFLDNDIFLFPPFPFLLQLCHFVPLHISTTFVFLFFLRGMACENVCLSFLISMCHSTWSCSFLCNRVLFVKPYVFRGIGHVVLTYALFSLGQPSCYLGLVLTMRVTVLYFSLYILHFRSFVVRSISDLWYLVSRTWSWAAVVNASVSTWAKCFLASTKRSSLLMWSYCRYCGFV